QVRETGLDRLHDVSTPAIARRLGEQRRRLLEQTDRPFERRRRQVHVALRGLQVGVPGELLDRPDRRAAHGQVRAEGVPQAVRRAEAQVGSPTREHEPVAERVVGER
ncbi:hypothetical protein RZS08_67350, partial [Arthrospira platensis SPKY1]|nr:hypothetical protein [Arthrospira platensis SPKY1]